jgi:hypothetical protein
VTCFRTTCVAVIECCCVVRRSGGSRGHRTCLATAPVEVFVSSPRNHFPSLTKKEEAEYKGKSTINPPPPVPQFVD